MVDKSINFTSKIFVNRIETIIAEEGKKFLSSHEKFEVDVKPKDKTATEGIMQISILITIYQYESLNFNV